MKSMAVSKTGEPASPSGIAPDGPRRKCSLDADGFEPRVRFAHLPRLAFLSAGLLLACSCASSVSTASLDPFLEQPSADSVPESPLLEQPRVESREARGGSTPTPVPLQHGLESPFYEAAELADADTTTPNRNANGAASQKPALWVTGGGAHVTPAEPRIDLVGFDDPSAPHAGIEGNGGIAANRAAAERGSADDYPDEYLIDGGDRALPIHYDRFNRLGIDTEDTVAEYVDHLGRHRVKPTNRVAIYAPRFGAVRSVTAPGGGTSVVLFEGVADVNRVGGVRNRLIPDDRTQRDSADRMRVRSRASGLEGDADRRGVHQTTAMAAHVRPLIAFEKLTLVGSGRFVQGERARLATGIQAALEWSRADSPVIVAQVDALQEIYARFKPQELIGSEDERRTAGELRIVKLADRKSASPGDVVTFTIRYDNLGDRELRHIRIIDNLTPRLEYVDDSATSDRAGRLDVEDNAEGSLLLKFVLDDPLPGHEGGVITFQARVR